MMIDFSNIMKHEMIKWKKISIVSFNIYCQCLLLSYLKDNMGEKIC